MKKILGISAFYHDSAAALSIGGKIVAAAQEERFTRIKNTADFPIHAIRYCLDFAGLKLHDLDAIVFYDKPILKFERLLETYYAFAPKGILSFLSSMPLWLNEKLFLKNMLLKQLKNIGKFDRKKLQLQFTEHHLSHAASTFYTSPYESAAILTIDGVGEWSTASIGVGKGNTIDIVKEMYYPHSVGLLYSAFTYFLGFKVNSGEYKLMGLAPFGNSNDEQTKEFEQIIRTQLIDMKADGSIWLNQAYFSYSTSLKMLDESKWERLFGLAKRKEESAIEQAHCNLALAIQQVTEDIILHMAMEAKRLTGLDNLCMAGGVALNCVANGKLLKSGLFKNIYIQAAAGDAGGAIGAALASSRLFFNETVVFSDEEDHMQGAYLGPEYADKEIQNMSDSCQAVHKKKENLQPLLDEIAQHLAEGKIIGWFQGRMEFGPRSLGNRSIIAYAGAPGMQEKINARIKYREGFRPFAPAVLKEDINTYFEMASDSPYMLMVAPLREKYRKVLPANYDSLNIWDKLKVPRSEFQAITHVDFSARVQGVNANTNPRFYALIESLKKKCGHGMLVNTSFNVRSEPVVCSPEDAYRCFMSTEMDYLVMNNYIFDKAEQNKDQYIRLPERKIERQTGSTRPEKSVFTLSIAFVMLYLIYQSQWLFNTALILGIAVVLSPLVCRWIDKIWMQISHVLSLVMPKIILGIVFYFVLFPLSILSNLFSKKDPLMLKNKYPSTFRDRHSRFNQESFEKMW